MGSSASKTAASAAGRAARQYPSRPSPASHAPLSQSQSQPQPAATPGPSVHPSPHASSTRDQAIDLDARDPDFASRLQRLGPVRAPSPTYSPSSISSTAVGTQPSSPSTPQSPFNSAVNYPSGTSSGPATGGVYPDPKTNPAIAILVARERIAGQVEAEKLAVGRSGWTGKTFLDVKSVRRALVLRDEQGMPEAEIEAHLGLKKGVLKGWGARGVVEAA